MGCRKYTGNGFQGIAIVIRAAINCCYFGVGSGLAEKLISRSIIIDAKSGVSVPEETFPHLSFSEVNDSIRLWVASTGIPE